MERSLAECIKKIRISRIAGSVDRTIKGLAYDSREVKPGWLFFALPGLHDDGHRYIARAIKSGAAGIICEKIPESPDPEAVYLEVDNPRLAMSPVSAAFYDYPARALKIAGVTATEGKSTTVYFIYQLLGLIGKKAGFFSTVMSNTFGKEMPNPEHQTTPEATAVQRMLAQMRDSGMEYAVVEASSHGLSKKLGRLSDVGFDTAVFMNVTHEHLEFHGTWEQYRDDKANLFRALGESPEWMTARKLQGHSGCGIVNACDPSAAYFTGVTDRQCAGFAVSGCRQYVQADFTADILEETPNGTRFNLSGPLSEGSGIVRLSAELHVPGTFNVSNATAAILAASNLSGIRWTEFIPLLPGLKPVAGRMTRVEQGQPFDILIDYAHTPSSFEAVLPPLRKQRSGKILCVFGSGGERDRIKRPLQGEIASRECDIVILADEDPRGEDPETLLREIAAGCKGKTENSNLFIIPDRVSAIKKAFSLADPGDLVLLLGKGHENSIIGKQGAVPYDELTTATSLLSEMGYENDRP